MQPDIEIYLLSCPTEKILDWLKTQFSILSEKHVEAKLLQIILKKDDQEITAQILEEAGGKRFTSIWFDSDKTPWQTDIECAKDAYAFLACEVRCCLASWQESKDEDPDQWWRINQHDEGPFIWK